MAGGIKPGQVPDWRPGAEFWKPLADGREVTVYPLLHGMGRLCVGPLADPHGYDIAYRYESVAAAIEAAKEWDGESSENPPDFAEIEFGKDRHPGTLSNPTDAPIPQVGEYVAPSARDDISMSQGDDGQHWISLTRVIDDGRTVVIQGLKKTRTDGMVLVEVHSVDVSPPPHHMIGTVKSSDVGAEGNVIVVETGGTTGGPRKQAGTDQQKRQKLLREISRKSGE
jgi:hypothetical protein